MSIVGAFIVPHPPIIVKEIGKAETQKVKATIEAYEYIAKQIEVLKPDTIILTSPHMVMYADYFHIAPGHEGKGDFGTFRAPEVQFKIKYDMEFVMTLSRLGEKKNFPVGTLGERETQLDHGTMVPLYFIGTKAYEFVRLSLSSLSLLEHYRLGKLVAETAELLNRKVVIVASGDLSHKLKEEGPYGYTKEGPQLDEAITQMIEQADFLSLLQLEPSFCEKAGECGVRSFAIMAGALDGLKLEAKLLAYEGPFGVGYGIGSFLVIGQDESRHFDQLFEAEEKQRLEDIKAKEDVYVKLARAALENYIQTGEILSLPKDLPDDLFHSQAGAFVSIKKEGALRGCIGTIGPVQPSLGDEIIRNAISAGTKDPRFLPITKEELPKLIYSVDVLGAAEAIQEETQLEVKTYGVIVTSGRKRGLLLPNLEGIETVQEQVTIAKEKAGISPYESYELQRFKVVRHQ